ncbi:hypothetical protein MYP_694 [Sporocytophaga myxococcoides]|uniref:Uncharacterized protein n=1 Tax=Sporocytophaga myxococcoides TaxID=153721 RepID=A0A098LAK4_9BACT|nr:hypothetical protein [Sporocytophaga myxococcoides]GAL83467.1 hypothetical protein MYP_694 [Sporocytophaga myxococcoides]
MKISDLIRISERPLRILEGDLKILGMSSGFTGSEKYIEAVRILDLLTYQILEGDKELLEFEEKNPDELRALLIDRRKQFNRLFEGENSFDQLKVKFSHERKFCDVVDKLRVTIQGILNRDLIIIQKIITNKVRRAS